MAMGGQDGYLSLSIAGLKNASGLGSCAESIASTLGGEFGSQVQRHSLLLTGPIASVQLYSFKAEEADCHVVVESLKHRAAQAVAGELWLVHTRIVGRIKRDQLERI